MAAICSRPTSARGGQVLLTLGPDVDPGTLADVIGADLGVTPAPVRPAGGAVTMVASDARHPIFRPFLNPSGALGDVLVEQYRRLNDQAGRVGAGAILRRRHRRLPSRRVGQGRVLVFTSDLDNQWSRFPLNAAFVPFAVEAARYLTAGPAPGAVVDAARRAGGNPAGARGDHDWRRRNADDALR